MTLKDLSRFKPYLKKISRFLIGHYFVFCLILIGIGLAFSGFLFQKYYNLIQETEIFVSKDLFKFQEETYQKVLRHWQKEEERFKEAEFKEYPDWRLTK